VVFMQRFSAWPSVVSRRHFIKGSCASNRQACRKGRREMALPKNLAQETGCLFHFGVEDGEHWIFGSLPEPPEGGTPNWYRSDRVKEALRADMFGVPPSGGPRFGTFFRLDAKRLRGSVALPILLKS